MITGLENLTCEERLRELKLFSLEKTLGRPHSSLGVLQRGLLERNSIRKYSDRVRDNGFKLQEDRFSLDVGRNSSL